MSLMAERRRVPLSDRDWLFLSTPPQPIQPIQAIFKAVADMFGIGMVELETSRKRNLGIVWPRQIAIYLMSECTPFGPFRIGRLVRLDPSTVRNAIAIVRSRREADRRVDQMIRALMHSLSSYPGVVR